MASVPGSMLNMENIIRKVYDHTTETLKTSGVSAPTNIVISSSDDSIAIGNVAGDLMTVHTDGSIDANIKGVVPVSGRLPVDIGSATVTISGPITIANEVEVKNDSGNPIPVNAASLPLPTGASTSALQSTANSSLVSIDSKLTSPLSVSGSTVALDSTSLAALENVTVQNGAGAAAVNIQDGGNSITVDGSVSVSNFPSNQTVSGTVTANAGANLNTSLLALDSTVAKDSSLATINTSVNSLLKPSSTLSAVTAITNTVTVKADTPANQTNALKVDGSAVTQPVSASSLPLPTGAATSALQTTGNTSLSNMDAKTPSLGQALSAASSPVVLPAAQITALTPLSSVAINNFPATQPISATALPLPTGAATETTVSSVNTKLPSGLTVKAASTPAVAADQALVVTLSPNNPVTATISNASIEISNDVGNPLPVNGTVVANIGTTNGLALDSSVNSLLKPASTLAAVTSITNTVVVKADTLANQTNAFKVDGSATTQPVSASTLPLPSGAATSALQTTGNTSIASIDTKTPALGQALSAASVPVVLPAAQITALTPLSTVTANLGTIAGVATETTLSALNTKVPSNLTVKPASTAAAATDPSLVVSISPNTPITATISNASIEISNDVGNPLPVNGTVTANIGTTNGLALDTSVNSLLKPASTLSAVTTVGGITNTVVVKADTLANQTNAMKVDGSATTQPISASSLPLPTGAATTALQTTGNTSLASIDTKTPVLGQALAAASVPVVLTAAQVSTLTPLSTVAVTQATGTNLHTVIDSGTVTATISGTPNVNVTNASIPVTGTFFQATQAISAASLPLPTSASTSALQTTGNNSLSSIDTKLPSGLAVTAGRLQVELPAGGSGLTNTELRASPVPVSGSVTVNAGTNLNTSALNLEATQVAMSAKLPATLGANTISNSMSVNIASDQTVKIAFANPIFDSSTAALAANATYTTPSFDSTNGAGTYLTYSAFSSTALSVTFQESSDNVNWSNTDAYTVGAGGSNYSAHKMSGRYGRVVVVNGPIANAGGVANLNILVAQNTIASETDVSIVDSLGNPISSVQGGTNTYNLTVAQSATNFAASTVNSTTAQLAAGATFTGTIETAFNQQSGSFLLTSDQNGTFTVNQYIDLAGTRKTSAFVFPIIAGIPFSKSYPVNGNFINVSFTNNGAVATTTLNINTAYGTIPSATGLGNTPTSLDEVNGTAFSLGTKTPALSLPVTQSTAQSYSASFQGAVTAVAATDIFNIGGSATKTIYITKIGLYATATASAIASTSLIKRSTANTAGTSTTLTNVPHDSNNAAATASVRAYTANPTLGTTVGQILNQKLEVVVATGAGTSLTPNSTNEYTFSNSQNQQPIVLRGTAEQLSINLNAASLTGNSFSFHISWYEV